MHLRSLLPGDFFGLDAAIFQFPHQIVTAISKGARQRNSLGVTVPACMHVLRVPSRVLEEMRKRAIDFIESHPITPNLTNAQKAVAATDIGSFPYVFDHETVEFLRKTFQFAPMHEARLRYLAAHTRPYRVSCHEFLFTVGQRVSTYLVRSGQLTLCASEIARSTQESNTISTTSSVAERRTVELEILQAHDCVGLLETCMMQSSFTRYCVPSSNEVCVFIISPVALLTALSQEPTSAALVADSLLRRHNWYALRLFTARNQHNPQREFKLSISAQQQRSPIPCSRCGRTGHVSTSSVCLHAESTHVTIATRETIAQKTQRQYNPTPTVLADTAIPVAGQRISRGRRLLHSAQLATLAILPSRHLESAFVDSTEIPSFPATQPTLVAAPDRLQPANLEVERRERRMEQVRVRLDDALQATNIFHSHSYVKKVTTAPIGVARPVCL